MKSGELVICVTHDNEVNETLRYDDGGIRPMDPRLVWIIISVLLPSMVYAKRFMLPGMKMNLQGSWCCRFAGRSKVIFKQFV